ncbi:adenylyl cyclase [Cadophora sp. DSE1049]|nr:adenylyl cyclase [Cadophora sp. DSE1049]
MPSSTQTPQTNPPPAGLLTCIFTDIIDSTAMWHFSEPATSHAITLHDRIIRRELTAHNGYEVKNLGDGFFIIFSCPLSALQFCLSAQRALQFAIWPPEIMAYRARLDLQNKADPRLTFRGLTVRMGIHYGKLYSEVLDPVHARLDYNGIVGCVASRVHRLAGGDEIAVSDAFIWALWEREMGMETGVKGMGMEDLDLDLDLYLRLDDGERRRILGRYVPRSRFWVRSIGEQVLRGVGKKENIIIIGLRRGTGKAPGELEDMDGDENSELYSTTSEIRYLERLELSKTEKPYEVTFPPVNITRPGAQRTNFTLASHTISLKDLTSNKSAFSTDIQGFEIDEFPS